MLRVEPVAEGVGDHLVGHDALVPRRGEPVQPVGSACRLEHAGHSFIVWNSGDPAGPALRAGTPDSEIPAGPHRMVVPLDRRPKSIYVTNTGRQVAEHP